MNEGLPKLGVLAIVCGDGTLRTLVVPHPNAVRKHMCSDNVNPQATVYCKYKMGLLVWERCLTRIYIVVRAEASRCTFALEGTKALVVSWGGHRKIAAGYVNGKCASQVPIVGLLT